MNLFRGLHNIPPGQRDRGCVLTIGNFDGVHRGHRAIIDQLAGIAAEDGAPSLLLTFEPHPRELFTSSPPPRLSRLREKLALLAETPLAQTLCVRFSRAFAAQSPSDFIERLLVEQLGARAVVVGDDFRFGRDGIGDVAQLRDAGARHGFSVTRCTTFEHAGRRVSSTWVREALAAGDLDLAAELLGRRYRVAGRIAYGDQIGRSIGFPTANVTPGRAELALSGVFAVRVHGLNNDNNDALPGVANVGRRPTVNGRALRLEVHLFDFNADVYGHSVEVEFVAAIRGERAFDSLDALKAQIAQDAEQARALLSGAA